MLREHQVVEHDALAEGPDIDAAYGLVDEMVGHNVLIDDLYALNGGPR